MKGNNENMLLDDMKVPEKMNLFQRIGNLFFAPSKLFAFIRKKPTVLLPIILISIGAIASQLLLLEQTKDMSLDLMYNTYKSMGMSTTPGQIEQLVNTSAIIGVAASPLTYLIVWLIATLLLYLVFRLVKCEKGLKKYFSMTGYILMITMVGTIIHSAYIYLTGNSLTSPMATSVASLLNPELQGTFLYGLSSQIEIFNLWTFVLFGIGFVYTGRVEKKKSFALTTILAVIVILGSAGLSLLSTGMQNNLMGVMGGY